MTATTYTRTSDQGTESIAITVTEDAVREIYVIDGTVCDDRIVASTAGRDDIAAYSHNRDAELRADGWDDAGPGAVVWLTQDTGSPILHDCQGHTGYPGYPGQVVYCDGRCQARRRRLADDQ